MKSKLLEFIAESENACCPYGYIILHADLTVRKHGRVVGVAKETIRAWRRAVATGEYDCRRTPHCLCQSGVIDPSSIPLRWKGQDSQ